MSLEWNMIKFIWNGYQKKKMTHTVKINVGFFYNIKIYTVDFIYLLINVPNKSVTLVSIQNIWGGGWEARGDLVVNGSTISAITLIARLFLNPDRPTVTYFELLFILTPKHLPHDPSRRFRLCLHKRVSIGICIVVKHSWKWTGYCWY